MSVVLNVRESLVIPCRVGQVSDGYHTFDELYEHRHMLFLSLMKLLPRSSWFSRVHADGSGYAGWFICGIHLPSGQVTYHLPDCLLLGARDTGATETPRAPAYDGHTSADVLARLLNFVGGSRPIKSQCRVWPSDAVLCPDMQRAVDQPHSSIERNRDFGKPGYDQASLLSIRGGEGRSLPIPYCPFCAGKLFVDNTSNVNR